MPFQKFNQHRLDEFISTHELPLQAREYIGLALAAPSRNVNGTTRNLTSDNPCPKMGCIIQAESNTAEARAALNHLFDDDVVFYLDQPPKIEIDYVNKDERRIRTSTTPDFLVGRLSTGLWIEEWKVASDREGLPDRKPGRYDRISGRVVSVPAEESASALKARYVVRFDDEIPINRTLNQRFLITYLATSAADLYTRKFDDVLKLFRTSSYLELSEILKSGADIDTIWWGVAHGLLQIDWDAVRLSKAHDILVFRDRETLDAYKYATTGLVSHGPRRTFSASIFSAGTRFSIDGIVFTVELAGKTKVFAHDAHGGIYEKEWARVEQMYQSGQIVVEVDPQEPISQLLDPLKRASPQQIQRAIERMATLDADHTSSDECSERTQRRWRAKVLAATASGQPGICGLIDNIPQRGYRGPHIDLALSAFIDQTLLESIKDNKHPTTHSIFNSVKKKVESAGNSMISRSAFYARVAAAKSLETIHESEGRKVAYAAQPTYWQLEQSTPIHCERSLELVHIDHTLLDDRPISMVTGEVRSRPWLTVAMDAYSRKVLGFWLSYAPPSYLSVMMVLYDMFKRVGRKPQAILTDWGPEFGATDLKDLCNSLGIRKMNRPKSAAKFGAVLERFFGVTNTQLIHNISGNTKATKNVRTLTRQVDPNTHAGLYLSDIYYGLEAFFFRIYNEEKKHPVWLRTPSQVESDRRVLDGFRAHEIVRVEDILPLLLPSARGTTRKIDASRGLNVNYEYYGNQSLAELKLSGAKAPVKIIPFNPGFVLAYSNGKWLHCRSKWADEFDEVPEFVRRAMYEDLLLERSVMAKVNAKADMSVLDLIEDLNQTAIKNKAYWAEPKTQAAVSDLGLMPKVESCPPLDSSDGFDEKIGAAIRLMQESGEYGALVQ